MNAPQKSPDVTLDHMLDALGQMADATKDWVGRSLDARDERIKQLEARIAAAEQSAAEFRYRGVWMSAVEYLPGNFCTHQGSLWHASARSKGIAPGTGSAGLWTLAVKRGRDGKERDK